MERINANLAAPLEYFTGTLVPQMFEGLLQNLRETSEVSDLEQEGVFFPAVLGAVLVGLMRMARERGEDFDDILNEARVMDKRFATIMAGQPFVQ